MSKENHSFSVSVALEIGIESAILLGHFCFIQKTNVGNDENWQDKWTKRTAKALKKTYPYWSLRQIRRLLDHMEEGEYLFSKVENEKKSDRGKSYIVAPKGLVLLGYKVLPNGDMDVTKREHQMLPNGDMDVTKREHDIKVGNTFLVPNLVGGNNAALPLSPPFQKTGEFLDLEAEKEKPLPPVAPAPPPVVVELRDPEAPTFAIYDELPTAPQNPPKASGRTKPKNPRSNEPAIHPENEMIFQHFSDPARARHAWVQWIFYKNEQHRERYKGAMSEAVKLRSLFKDSGGDSEAVEQMIEQSIGNTWKGIFKLKNEIQNGGSHTNGLNAAQRQHLTLARFVAETRLSAVTGDGRKMEYITGAK